MTLSEMAEFVTNKVNQTEAEDITACKSFLTQRHKLIWNDQLWKDALVDYSQTLSPDDYAVTSNWLPSLGVLLLPPIIQRVIAVRNDTRHLNVQRSEIYYRTDYDAFAKTGSAREYVLLSPCVWQIQAAASLYLFNSNEGDAGTVVSADALDSDGVGVTRYDVTMNNSAALIASTTRIDAITKGATSESIQLLYSDQSTVLVIVPSTTTSSQKRQRIRFVEIPTAEMTVRVLGKRSVPAFEDDNDEPAINGSDNLLLSLAEHDMWRRCRQFGFANDLLPEINSLLDQLKKIEVVQQAHNIRIVPEDGYGSVRDLTSQQPLTF